MEVLDDLEDSYEKYLVDKADSLRLPLGATFELSPLCNFQCKMCYIEQKRQEVDKTGGLQPLEFWIKLAEDAANAGSLYVLLTGGEPLLYPDFKKLYKALKALGMYIVINTNASLLDRDMIHFLGDDPPKRINVSLYGANCETYKRLCGNGSMFQRVLTNLEMLKEYNLERGKGMVREEFYQKQPGIPVRIHTVLTPDNYNDYEGIVSIANHLEFPLSFVPYVFPSVRKGDTSLNLNARFDPCTAGCVKYRYQKDAHEGSFHEFVRDNHKRFTSYMENPLHGCQDVACRGGISTYWVNWKGEMSSCGMIPGPWFDLKKNSFDACWESVRQATDRMKLNSECSVCQMRQFCPTCVAASYAETGDFSGKPSYLCRMTEQYMALMEEEYRKLFEDMKNEL